MFKLLDKTLVREFRVDATASGWGVLEGTVRPATPRETRSYTQRLAKAATDDEVVKIQAAFYAEHIKTWNCDKPVIAEILEALPLPIWDRLEAVVTGYSGEALLGNSVASSGS